MAGIRMSPIAGCCGICGGELELRYRGAGGAPAPDDLSPTSHPTGAHADILSCGDCGTLQQLSLLQQPDLAELYREMRDDAYLEEEGGRRRTAIRLLELIGSHVPTGRLLDVGCGHGLLLDEARRRGYETVGLEVSAAAAAFARDVLEVDVREQTIEEIDDDERFDVITLIDVLEHLSDPVATITRCGDLLSPDGVLCLVTPDPSSFTARLAGRRWWALVPAHSYLVPRRTLLELLTAHGLAIAGDVPFVRSFSVGYWFAGLAERSGRLMLLGSRLVRAFGERISLSLSLRDERVVLASKVQTLKPARRLVQDRGGVSKVHVVLPAYNAASTIPIVSKTLPTGAADRALLVDDASTDQTSAVALHEGFEVICHPVNRGYGANQKTCYVRAALDGANIVVMVHADHQYDPGLVAEMVMPIAEGRADVVIGSRLLEDKAIAGGMPRWKWVGNRLLTTIENWAFGQSHSEYHTGYRAFSVDFLRTIPFLRNSDSFVFDQEIFAQIVARGGTVVELAIPTRYFLEASSVSFFKSVDYGLRTLWVLVRFRIDVRRRRWPLLRRPAVTLKPESGDVAHIGSLNSPPG
jgi:2-polyprenyl-3-methyl-5-hydroxy-6-metoxy-1,4-benzoquinol methylase